MRSYGFRVSKLGVVAPGPVVNVESVQEAISFQLNNNNQQSDMKVGVSNWLEESNTMSVSLQDRKPAPTKEEIAQKKKNFNLWLWGGACTQSVGAHLEICDLLCFHFSFSFSRIAFCFLFTLTVGIIMICFRRICCSNASDFLLLRLQILEILNGSHCQAIKKA